MEVPSWLLILLAVLSINLLVLVLIFLLSVIKNCIYRRKYDQIIPQGKYVPGKLFAYFKGNEDMNSAIIPKTFPAIMQTRNPFFAAPWKVIPYRSGGSIASSASSNNIRPSLSSTKLTDHRSTATHFASQSFGDVYRKPPRNGLGGSLVEMRKLRSPFAEVIKGECASQGSSRSGSVGEVPKTEDVNNATSDDCHRVYSHSDFFMDVENSPSFGDDDPIISYDQKNYPTAKKLGAGSLFFILEYYSRVPELLITIKSGLHLPPISGDVKKPLNSYVNFCLVPEDFLWQRTKLVVNNNSPVYNETFSIHDVLYHKLREYTLCFFVMDCTQPMGERVIGKVLYPLSDLRAEDRVEVCKELSPP